MEESMLTTKDNPFDPFTDYDNWFAFDSRLGYNTPAFLARVVRTSDELSDADQSVAIENAIDEIVSSDLFPDYVKVSRKSEIV